MIQLNSLQIDLILFKLFGLLGDTNSEMYTKWDD